MKSGVFESSANQMITSSIEHISLSDIVIILELMNIFQESGF